MVEAERGGTDGYGSEPAAETRWKARNPTLRCGIITIAMAGISSQVVRHRWDEVKVGCGQLCRMV